MRPPPVLDDAIIADMTRFLEARSGSMDFGQFTRKFRGFKKSQLEPHFTLTQEEADAGGRWQITLLGQVPKLGPGKQDSLDEEVVVEEEDEEEHVEVEPGDPGIPAGGDQTEEDLGRQVGVIYLWDGARGYGFVKSDDVPQGDIYFRRNELPSEVQSLRRERLVGAAVELSCKMVAGRPRGFEIQVLKTPDAPAGKDGEAPERHEKAAGPPPAPLSEEKLAEMREFLAEQGGSTDFGKFSNNFAGVKKAQLEEHFQFVAESSNHPGGRWQILLPGAEPQPLPPLRETRQRPERPERPPRREPPTALPGPGPAEGGRRRRAEPPQMLEPSPTLWLMGFVQKFNAQKNFGFLAADGTDDVFFHRNDLPVELQSWDRDVIGVEMTFGLVASEDGKLRVDGMRALLGPDGRGGWQVLRRT